MRRAGAGCSVALRRRTSIPGSGRWRAAATSGTVVLSSRDYYSDVRRDLSRYAMMRH